MNFLAPKFSFSVALILTSYSQRLRSLYSKRKISDISSSSKANRLHDFWLHTTFPSSIVLFLAINGRSNIPTLNSFLFVLPLRTAVLPAHIRGAAHHEGVPTAPRVPGTRKGAFSVPWLIYSAIRSRGGVGVPLTGWSWAAKRCNW